MPRDEGDDAMRALAQLTRDAERFKAVNDGIAEVHRVYVPAVLAVVEELVQEIHCIPTLDAMPSAAGDHPHLLELDAKLTALAAVITEIKGPIDAVLGNINSMRARLRSPIEEAWQRRLSEVRHAYFAMKKSERGDL